MILSMTRRLLPIVFLMLCTLTALQAQVPETVKVAKNVRSMRNAQTCDPGDTPFGGTATPSLHPDASSININFLCRNDTAIITHAQNWDFSGDPNMGTQAGIGYIFYECDPSGAGITGPSIDDIENDPCLELTPTPTIDPNFANFWVARDPVNFNGNTIFWNGNNTQSGQTLQDFFAGGDPVQFWFAPVTIDDYFDPEYEVDGNGDRGGCVHANVGESFSIVFLNEIEISNINPNFGGNGCTATFDVTGGLPEWDRLANNRTLNYDIDISLSTNPSVKGSFSGAFTHNETVQFLVPQPGTYNVTVSDSISCAASFQIDMSACTPVTFEMPQIFANAGPPIENVCLDITVQNFVDVTSFQFLIKWDDAVLAYTGVNPGVIGPPELTFGPPVPTDSINFSFFDFTLQPLTIGNGQTVFSICFDVIGNPGDVSPVTFEPIIESQDINQIPIAVNVNGGEVRIISGNLMPSFTSCSTTPLLSNGSFELIMTGGAPPYQITWVEQANPANNGTGNIAMNGGSFSQGNLPPGTYDITITDANAGQTFTSVTIINADPLFVQTNFTNPTCAGDMDGTISITMLNGGVAPLDIEWSEPGNNGAMMLTGLSQGTYSVTVTDNNGCSATSVQGVGVSAIVIDTATLNHVSCNGAGDDGAITVFATGGTITPPSDYTYTWDNAATGPSLTGLIPGTYCVTVSDDNNCTSNTCIEVLDAMRPMITGWDSVSVICANDTNGELTVIATPGNAAITGYEWSSGATNATATGLSSGVYTVTITAADGCTTVGMQQLFAPGLLVLDSTDLESPSCPGVNNGSVAVFVSGGTQPFEYQWSTGTISQFPREPALFGDSTYSVTVIDGNNCDTLIIPNLFLADPPEITVVYQDTFSVSCNGGIPCDGRATALASGGTAGTGNYDFNWANGESDMNVMSSSATMLCQGWNVIEVNDGLCSVTDSVFISAPPVLTFDPLTTMGIPPSCNGGTDGGAMIGGNGGTPGYTFAWSTSDTGPSISGVGAGTYTVTITDLNMCEFSLPIQVREPDVLVALIDTTTTMNVSCDGDTDGQIGIIPQGGTGPYAFDWAGGVSNSSVAIGLVPGTYNVTVTDANGCTADTVRVITSPPRIFATIPTPEEPLCFGFQTLITVDTAFGGNGPLFRFSVDNGPQQLIGSGVPVLAGTHSISVFDMNGCSTDTILTINEPLPVSVSLGVDQEIQLGDSAIIEGQILEVVPIDTINWNPLETLTCLSPDCRRVSVKPLNSTEYFLTAIDTNGCIGVDAIFIEVDKNRNVFIPNIFTPEGDGINDFFKPFIGPGVVQINFFQVYDRWGELVHQANGFVPSNDLTGNDPNAWDGFFKGKKMNSGVYVYLISVSFVDGVELLYRGDVTLIR